MSNNEWIAASAFCSSHEIDVSFITSLSQSGLIETTVRDEGLFFNEDQLPELERMVRFYYEMDINLQGIETIQHLLFQIGQMQEEMKELKTRLHIYEQMD
jgi:chaperone modulatory protein CbpM